MYLRKTIKEAQQLNVKRPLGGGKIGIKAAEMAATSCKGLILTACLAAVLLFAVAAVSVDCQEQVNVESRQQKENDDLTAEIKYLENLDNIYSQVGRPRWGRSEYKQSKLLGARANANLQLANGQRQLGSLADLISARLAQSRYSEQAY